jgi:hypothetical protein
MVAAAAIAGHVADVRELVGARDAEGRPTALAGSPP